MTFKIKVIGLTGKYCSGKNHVAGILEKNGYPILDVDALGHKVIEMEKDAIINLFGQDIIGKDGNIDRKALGAKVFGNPEKLAALEGIVHPGANRETVSWINKQDKPCFINAALLHRSSVFDFLDAIIIVKASFFSRILRAIKRDKLPLKAILKRIKTQKNFYTQYFSRKTDILIVKNSGFTKPENRIKGILSHLGI